MPGLECPACGKDVSVGQDLSLLHTDGTEICPEQAFQQLSEFAPRRSSPQLPENERASEIEARLRMEIEPWGVRDRRIGFPCGLVLMAAVLIGLSAWALAYVALRIF